MLNMHIAVMQRIDDLLAGKKLVQIQLLLDSFHYAADSTKAKDMQKMIPQPMVAQNDTAGKIKQISLKNLKTNILSFL